MSFREKGLALVCATLAALAVGPVAWANPGGASVAINFAADEAPDVRSDVTGAAVERYTTKGKSAGVYGVVAIPAGQDGVVNAA